MPGAATSSSLPGVGLDTVHALGGTGLGGATLQGGEGVGAGVDDGDVVPEPGQRDGEAAGAAADVDHGERLTRLTRLCGQVGDHALDGLPDHGRAGCAGQVAAARSPPLRLLVCHAVASTSRGTRGAEDAHRVVAPRWTTLGRAGGAPARPARSWSPTRSPGRSLRPVPQAPRHLHGVALASLLGQVRGGLRGVLAGRPHVGVRRLPEPAGVHQHPSVPEAAAHAAGASAAVVPAALPRHRLLGVEPTKNGRGDRLAAAPSVACAV
ncbi:hypothetical protein GCM10025868_06880 [Angustibacter aerolatus]|uniref:Uncharacterized protein n=1 Tax=Angustibacter aerolatus TaxID=1162965 RepID=A0ABQ6JB74_9ACTN|nr:hypothetical protein GCM10025868_06880 [Angustibacter aerolatus]